MLTPHVIEHEEKIQHYIMSLGISKTKLQNKVQMLQAFVHKSYAADHTEKINDNERLEFLGDSILGTIVATNLFHDFPEYSEDKLTLYKIALVREETLAITATEIKLNQYIFISKGEQKSQGRQKAAILADCLEALIGYLYVDCGYDTASYFIKKYLYKKVNNIEDYIPVKSHKSRVQEYIQKLYKILPNYRDTQDQIDETGNIIRYKAELYLNQRLLSTGYGPSKKKAQEDAAKEYLKKDPNRK